MRGRTVDVVTCPTCLALRGVRCDRDVSPHSLTGATHRLRITLARDIRRRAAVTS